MKLVLTELKRLRWRGTHFVALLALLGIAVFNTLGVYEGSSPPSQQIVDEMRQDYENYYQEWLLFHEVWYEDCLEAETLASAYADSDEDEYGVFAWDCESELVPPVEDDWKWFYQEGMEHFLGYVLVSIISMVLLVGLFLGASFTAAELSSGSMGTWLTFEPRRSRVYFSKLGALFVWGTMLAAAGLTVIVLLSWFVTSLNGAGDLSSQRWVELGLMVARAVPLVGIIAAIGGALGIILRNTAATVGLVFVWAAMAEPIITRAWMPQLAPLGVTTNIYGWLQAPTWYYREDCVQDFDGSASCEHIQIAHSGTASFIYVIVAALIIALMGWLIFRRRDIR